MAKKKWHIYRPKEGTPLTDREMEILKMLCLPNVDIAYRKNTTVGTIKQTRFIIFKKLGVHTRSAAIVTAIRQGLIDIWDVILPTDVF